MSTEEKGVEESTTEPSSSKLQQPREEQQVQQQQIQQQVTDSHSITPQSSSQEPVSPESIKQTPQNPKTTRQPPDQSTSDATYPSTPENTSRPKQVIAVNASKGPAAFFNLARKFLVADEVCDLSALEGAIVSAADAAHLLERSQLATIVRIQTSYATVEPKRRRQQQQEQQSPYSGRPQQQQNRELRRARIVITVKRTEQYKRWLDENPYQAVLAGDGAVEEDTPAVDDSPETPPSIV